MEKSRLTTVLNVNQVHSRRLKRRPNGSHEKPEGLFGCEVPPKHYFAADDSSLFFRAGISYGVSVARRSAYCRPGPGTKRRRYQEPETISPTRLEADLEREGV